MKPKHNRFLPSASNALSQQKRNPLLSRSSSLRLLPVFSALVLSASSALAQLTYDANLVSGGAQDGAGAGWNVAADPVNWVNGGGTNVAWSTANTTADTAIFGAAPAGVGATVVVGTVNVGTIRFNSTTTTGYTLSTGTITLGSGITTNQNTVTSTISAKITGSNGLAFVGVSGQIGAVTLSNNTNDYTGITTASTGGRLVTAQANALGSSAGATASALGLNYTQVNTGSQVVLNAGSSAIYNEAFIINGVGPSGGSVGALRFAQSNITTNSLIQLGSNASIVSNSAGGATFAGNLELGTNTLTLDGFGGSNTISGVISGATGSLNITSGGTAVYNITNALNTYGGNTSLARTVGVGDNAALGTSTIVFSGGGGIQSTDSTARTLSNVIGTFGANVGVTFGQTTVQTGTLTFTNATTSSLGTTGHVLTTNVDTSFASGFSGTGGAAITKTGAAKLTLTGTSTYVGGTTITTGILQLGNGGTTGSLATTGGITNNANLTINRSNAVTQGTDFSAAGISGTGSLTQAGSGTTTLNVTSTYTGATNVNAGTLVVNGNISTSSLVSVSSGATLAGSGTVGAASVSGTLAIGNSPGTMNFSSLALGSGSTYLYEMTGGGVAADLGVISGALSINTASILDLVELGAYTVGNKFTLFAYDGAFTGNFSGLVNNSTFLDDLSNSWVIKYDDSTAGLNGGVSASNTYVTITAIPEPSAALLGGLGVLALLRRRRNA